jgi:hypothetical protein
MRVLAALLLALVLAATGCSSSSRSSAPSASPSSPSPVSPSSPSPVSPLPAAPPGSASRSAAAAAPAPAPAGPVALPTYEPSTVVNQETGSATWTSPDSVSKIAAFYVDALANGGWQTVSKNTSFPYSGNLIGKRAGEGVAVTVAATGRGSLIHVSTYPRR